MTERFALTHAAVVTATFASMSTPRRRAADGAL